MLQALLVKVLTHLWKKFANRGNGEDPHALKFAKNDICTISRPANRVRISRLNHISQNSRFEAFRSLKIVENALSSSGLYRTKSVVALSHTLGGARKRIAVHQNGKTSSYILRSPAFWGCAKTLRPAQRWSKGGW